MKKVISLIFAVLLLIGANFSAMAYAENYDGTITAGTASAKPGETVDVTITLGEHPGLVSLQIDVGYNADALTLTGITDEGKLSTFESDTSNLTANPYTLTWNGDLLRANITYTGVITTLTFAVKENATPGDYDITIRSYDAMNYDMDDLYFENINGKVTVTADIKPEVIEGVYHENGEPVHKGVVRMGDDLYYVASNGIIAKNTTKWIGENWTNGLIEPGTYQLDENGKILPRNGIIGERYYENNVEVHKGVIEIDGDYYYIASGGIVAKNTYKWIGVNWTNGLIEPGTYQVDENGKILPRNGIIGERYYENNVEVHKGVIEIDGDYYYIASGGIVAKNTTKWIGANWTNGLLPAGTYQVDENGKIVMKNGIIGDRYYENNVEVHKGVIEIDGDYYYIASGGRVAKNTTKWVGKNWTNGLIAPGIYQIDENGIIVF